MQLSLTNSQGLGKVLQFNGLGLKITVLPSTDTCGEPFLTKQAIYFLKDLEATAKIKISADSVLSQHFTEAEMGQVIEYLLDNYLFVYSTVDDQSRITSKVEKPSFLEDKRTERFEPGDKGNVKYLVVDILNDRSVISCKDLIEPDLSYESDWLLFNSYFERIYDRYLKEIDSVLDRKVALKTRSSEEILPILRFLNEPYKYAQLAQMSDCIEYVEEKDARLRNGIYEYHTRHVNFEIPMQHIFAGDYYNKYLLDLYSAGLRETSPLLQFKYFYNIIEYVFEDATIEECRRHLPEEIANSVDDLSSYKDWIGKLDRGFRYDKSKLRAEETQLDIAVNMFVERSELTNKILTLDTDTQKHFQEAAVFTKDVKVPPIRIDDDNLLTKYARRIYLIRNSVIHTKRTIHGDQVPAIMPFSEQELFLEKEIPLIKLVAQKVVQKEKDTFQYTAISFSPLETFLFISLLHENENFDTLIKNLGFFLYNLHSKLKGERYYDFLDPIIFFLLDIFDDLRLHDPDKLEIYRQELLKINLFLFDEVTQAAIKCLVFILQNEMASFEDLVEKLPRRSMRANLHRLRNSMDWYFGQKRKSNLPA